MCGNDGKTYGNLCELTSTACSQNQTVVVAAQGECGKCAYLKLKNLVVPLFVRFVLRFRQNVTFGRALISRFQTKPFVSELNLALV